MRSAAAYSPFVSFVILYSLAFVLVFVSVGIVLPFMSVRAQTAPTGPRVTVTPALIDESTRAREKSTFTVTLTNTGDQKAELYAIVEDIAEQEGAQGSKPPEALDRSRSLASWIRIKRGVTELWPGASTTLELTIETGVGAVPGRYHAAITFALGGNLPAARATAATAPMPRLLLNITVADETVEKASLSGFRTGRNLYLRNPVDLHFRVGNTGNVPVTPAGAIFLENRRGQSVDRLAVTMDPVAAGGSSDVPVTWSGGRMPGKYKARLELDYGERDRQSLQDTIYFWILPVPILIGFIIAILAVTGLSVFLLFRRTYAFHRQMQSVEKERQGGVIDLREE